MEQWNNETIKNGMTLIEMLVVTAIMVILTGTFLLNYRAAQDRFALQRSANKLAQDIRRVKAMAMSAEEYPPGSGDVPETGYGIFFNIDIADTGDDKRYILYADTGGGEEFFVGSDDIIETVSLEEGVFIERIILPPAAPRVRASINFRPPDPKVRIKFQAAEGEDVKIILALESDSSIEKIVSVNNLGLVTVE